MNLMPKYIHACRFVNLGLCEWSSLKEVWAWVLCSHAIYGEDFADGFGFPGGLIALAGVVEV